MSLKENTTAVLLLIFIIGMVPLTGCSSLTGIPSHGGGKRFAIEQELVSATVRATVKDLDVRRIKGMGVTLYINSIGDQGSGTLLGGRYSISSLIRGQAINSPVTYETATFPVIQTVNSSKSSTTASNNTSTNSESSEDSNSSTTGDDQTTTTRSAGDSRQNGNSSTITETTTHNQVVAPYPGSKRTEQKGGSSVAELGVQYKGLGSYTNSDRAINKDIQFLSAAVQTFLYLKGVHVVPPSEAEVDFYINVDVFGTIRSRIEWFVANNEILKSKTAIEMLAVDHNTGEILIAPQVTSYEAEYNEQYILWAGPVSIKKYLYKSDGLLCDYTDVLEGEETESSYLEKDMPLSYPFQGEFRKKNIETQK